MCASDPWTRPSRRARATRYAGFTANTVANIPSMNHFSVSRQVAWWRWNRTRASCYSGLEGSLTKRFTHGLETLSSYTYSKTLDTHGLIKPSAPSRVVLASIRNAVSAHRGHSLTRFCTQAQMGLSIRASVAPSGICIASFRPSLVFHPRCGQEYRVTLGTGTLEVCFVFLEPKV